MKRRRRWTSDKAKSFVVEWVITFGATAGIVSGVVALTPLAFTILHSSVLITGCGMVASAIAWRRASTTHLPVETLAPLEECPVLYCPCDDATARDAGAMTYEFYGAESIDSDRYSEWLQKNPYILACLLNRYGDVEGYFDILPLTPDALDQFIEGGLTEADIDATMILAPSEATDTPRIYLGGMAVRNPRQHQYQRYAAYLLWGILKYIQEFYPVSTPRELYALASTPEGEVLLRKFGFRIAARAKAREDDHDLYVLPLSEFTLRDLQALIPDWTNHCKVSWAQTRYVHELQVYTKLP